MALKSYVITQDFKTPYVMMTGIPHKPQSIRFKEFKKGEVVNGELKHANNKPAFILVKGVCVVPLSVVKELITKEVVENADGKGGTGGTMDSSADSSKKQTIKISPKIKVIDGMIFGALAGYGGVFLAEKQNWITSTDNKNKLYGAVGGALLFGYIVHRLK